MNESLRVSILLRHGALALDVQIAWAAPWTCHFGISGSGKSTVMRAVAGLVRPEEGQIVLCGRSESERVLFDSGSGVWVPPHKRPVRTAAQQAWLFPGTVRRNVGYAVMPRDHAQWVKLVLERFRLRGLATADVRTLSGGERQRVSVARAVAAAVFGDTRADLLLLDEPFAGMDTRLRDELAGELRDWLGELQIPVLSVTHDVGEAFVLRAEVIRIAEGKIVAQGPVAEVLAEERLRLRSVLGEKGHAR